MKRNDARCSNRSVVVTAVTVVTVATAATAVIAVVAAAVAASEESEAGVAAGDDQILDGVLDRAIDRSSRTMEPCPILPIPIAPTCRDLT